MTINLTPGITQSVWLSLREAAPVGYTGSFVFVFTNDITGATKSSTLSDLQPTNKWSRFDWCVKTPENLNAGQYNFKPGMWSFQVTASGVQLETGKVFVSEAMTWSTIERPAKNTGAIRR